MKNTGFDKALFKSAVTFNVKNMFRRTIDEATPQQIFQAVAYTVKDDIIDQWITTHKEYEKKDDRIHIIDKENTGVSDSRNVAIAAATGTYLQFMDSDDWLTPDATERLAEFVLRKR